MKFSYMTDDNYPLFSTPILHPNWIFRWTSDGRKFYRNCAAAHRKAEEIIRKRRKALQENVRNQTK